MTAAATHGHDALLLQSTTVFANVVFINIDWKASRHYSEKALTSNMSPLGKHNRERGAQHGTHDDLHVRGGRGITTLKKSKRNEWQTKARNHEKKLLQSTSNCAACSMKARHI